MHQRATLYHYGFPMLCLGLILISSKSSHQQQTGQSNDPDEPLFLTPFLQQGKIQEARQAAKVSREFFSNQKSYSGYLTINEEYNSNLFFWFFTAKQRPSSAPLLIWLAGGPGVSTMFSVFMENGPLNFTATGDIGLREYSWTNYFNMIYIDNPVGVGYSFADNERAYVRSQEDVGQDVYEALKQLYRLFPEFEQLPLYITGASYGGHFVASTAYTIYKAQQQFEEQKSGISFPMKLNGIAMQNAFVDPVSQMHYGQNLYNYGLIDMKGLDVFLEVEGRIQYCLQRDDEDCVLDIRENIVLTRYGTTKRTLFTNLTGYDTMTNVLTSTRNVRYDLMQRFGESDEVRRRLHVGNNSFVPISDAVIRYIGANQFKSVVTWIAELLDHVRVCIFLGQVDTAVPYWTSINYLRSLRFHGSDSYKMARRKIWRVENEVAGYVKEGGNLVEVLVRNAGHLLNEDQPKRSLDIVKRFVFRESFSD